MIMTATTGWMRWHGVVRKTEEGNYTMKFDRFAKTAVAATGVAAFAMTVAAGAVNAADGKKEKCYGIVAKESNDCGTSTHSCANQAKVDGHPEEWIYLPAGFCERIAGGKLKSPK